MALDLEQKLERLYLTSPRRLATYVAREELNLIWDITEVREIDLMWKRGESLEDMGERFGRDLDEIAILLLDRVRKGNIKARKGGVFGG